LRLPSVEVPSTRNSGSELFVLHYENL
jgi:hypothetical protein